MALPRLPEPHNPPQDQAQLLAAVLQSIVALVGLGSIVIRTSCHCDSPDNIQEAHTILRWTFYLFLHAWFQGLVTYRHRPVEWLAPCTGYVFDVGSRQCASVANGGDPAPVASPRRLVGLLPPFWVE